MFHVKHIVSKTKPTTLMFHVKHFTAEKQVGFKQLLSLVKKPCIACSQQSPSFNKVKNSNCYALAKTIGNAILWAMALYFSVHFFFEIFAFWLNSSARLTQYSKSIWAFIPLWSIITYPFIGLFVKSMVLQPFFSTLSSCNIGSIRHINSSLIIPTHILLLYIKVKPPIIFFLQCWVVRQIAVVFCRLKFRCTTRPLFS